MSFIKGDNSGPLPLLPCTKSALCSFAFLLQYQAASRCKNKGSSGLNKLLIWTMAVSKSAGPLTGNIFLSCQICPTKPSPHYLALRVCLYCNFLRAVGPRVSLLLHFPDHLRVSGAKLTFFVFTAPPLISSCFVPPTATPDIA